MAAARLLDNLGAPLLPDGTITGFESRDQASASTASEITGKPVIITLENAGSNESWSLEAAYQPNSVLQACIAAYKQDMHLTLVDELGTSLTCTIAVYPEVVRHKQVDGSVVFTITLTLQAIEASLSVPTLSTSGPTLFS